MKIEFSRERRIINALMKHAGSINDLGLLNGKMGIVLYFFYLGRLRNNNEFTLFAEELLDEVVETLNLDLPVDFEDGITGIGWAVEYFIRNGFVDADADEILEEIDATLKSVFIYEDCTINTIISIGYYLIFRISYRLDNEDSVVLDIKYHIILLVDEIERQIVNGGTSALLYNFLTELHKLNVFNYKVEKLLVSVNKDTCNYLLPYVPRFTAQEIEIIINRKDIKTKYAGFDMKHIPTNERWGLKSGLAGWGLQKIFIEHGL